MKHLLQAKSNSLFSNSLFIFLIRFFPSLANVLVVILFSRALDRESYGAYQSFWTHLIVLSAIACMGIQSFSLTYPAGTIRLLLRKAGYAFYTSVCIWMILSGVVFAALHHGTFNVGWYIPVLYLLIYALSVIAESVLIVFRRYSSLVVISLLHTTVFCILHLLLLKGMINWDGLFLGLLITGAVRMAIYMLFLRTAIGDGSEETSLDRPATDYISLWLHLGIYDITQVLFRWIDKAIIVFFVGEEFFAIYYNGSIDIPFLPLLLGAVAGAGLMRLAEIKSGDEKRSALVLVNRTGRLLSCVVFPLFFFFAVFRYELFSVVLSAKYLLAVPIFLVSVTAMPLRAYGFTTLLQNHHKGSVINAGAIGDLLLACALMYPLYLMFGLPGVALSFVISSYLQAVFYLYHTSKLLDVSIAALIPVKNWLVKFIVFGCSFIVFHYVADQYFEPLIVLLWGGILAVLTILASLWIEYKNTLHYGDATQAGN